MMPRKPILQDWQFALESNAEKRHGRELAWKFQENGVHYLRWWIGQLLSPGRRKIIQMGVCLDDPMGIHHSSTC
jgi:hypothetical protein